MHKYINENEVVELLSNLIKIHSPYFHEEKIMDYVLKWLEENGIECSLHKYEEKAITGFSGLNIVGRIKGKTKGPKVLLNGHLDTVNICEGWLTKPLEPKIIDEKLFGLGALDMKSGVAALLLVLKEINEIKDNLKGEIIFSFVSDEEGPYGLGTNNIIDDKMINDADVAIVTEPSSGFTKKSFPCVCLGARGGYNYTVNFYGKSAHAANPEEGINAVSDASRVALNLEKTELMEDEKLGKGSICIVDFKGGHDVCSVPDTASFTVFRHIVRGESKDTIIKEVEEAIKKSNIKSEYEINIRKAPSEEYEGFQPYTVDEDNKYTKKFLESVKTVTGKNAEISYFSSIGDFNFIASRLGIPTFVFGPDGKNYHTHDEHVIIPTVVKTAEVIYNFIRENNF